MRHLTFMDINMAARNLARYLPSGVQRVWGIPRGGVSAAYALINQNTGLYLMAPDAESASIIVDDLVDSGATMKQSLEKYPDKFHCALFTKNIAGGIGNHICGETLRTDEWVVFPWEQTQEGSASDIVTRFLQYIGEDPAREGLKETPARVIKAWGEWFGGYKSEPKEILKSFTDGADNVDEMVLVKDIPFYSHCEHHLAPFFGVAHVSYIPRGKIVGLSKLGRLVDAFSRRLQVQERLTNQIADALQEVIQPTGVGVVLEARHLCMESRGIQRSGSSTVTSAMRGVMLTKPEARAELMALIARR